HPRRRSTGFEMFTAIDGCSSWPFSRKEVERPEAGDIHLIRRPDKVNVPCFRHPVRRPFPVPLTTPNTMQSLRDPGSPPVHAVIPSDAAEPRHVQDQVEQYLQATACHDHDLFSIKLALEEALVNAIKHGNQCDRSKQVQIAYRLL